MSALPQLRSLLEKRFPDATPVTHRTAEPVTTGVQPLDALLPGGRLDSLRCAEELLRCGGFALLVLSGAEPEGTEMVRLSRAAREGGSAFVALTPHTSMASLRLTSRILPQSYRWRRSPFGDPAEARSAMIRVRAYSLGWNRETEFSIPIARYDQRISLEAGIVDRRGVITRSVKGVP